MAKKTQHSPAGTPAIVALTAAGVTHAVHVYDHDPGSTLGYGLEAATALGVEPERVFKTIMCAVDGVLTVAIVPVTGQVDLKALAAASGGKKAELADQKAAERATGYVVGGISPIGQRTVSPSVLDETAMLYDTVLVSGGRRGLDVELAPGDLAAVVCATVAPIGRGQ